MRVGLDYPELLHGDVIGLRPTWTASPVAGLY
jgi:hypothetical protein